MPVSETTREESITSLSRLLSWSSGALLLIFLAFVLIDSLPPQLLNPAWQLRFTNRMTNTSILALLGFLLLHLAVFFEPANGLLRARLVAVRHWAIVVAFAFLLLVPLQGVATWRILSQARGSQALQRNALDERVTRVREAIEAATSPADLQARFSRLQGARPQLPAAALNLPLGELKRNLLDELQKSETRASSRIGGPAPADVWSLGQGMVKVTVASVGFATAFAAGARRPGHSLTILEQLIRRLEILRGRRPNRRRRSP
ncbi:hypothetical protein KBZ08_14475 [Cyanobium sp. Candia 9D4]|uniref:hypothetical protein n=1 Tax=Cyanobium sp. Candia 9D4 TaxID=2823707 RepID=UPI0020CF4FD6|nr:hypothetical protein [Cyanobium sp. Candia 9D4]MCP9935115.1 hypothetical protein [Cyanobium sp. Candia 9D4]